MFSLRGVWSRCVMLMVMNWYYCFHIIEIYVAAIVVIIIYHYFCKVTTFFQIWVCGCIIEIYVVATVQGNARHRKIYEKHLHIWAVWITKKKKTTHIYMILYDIYMSRLNHSKKKTTHIWCTVDKHVDATNISAIDNFVFAVLIFGLWSGCCFQVSAKCVFFLFFSSSFSFSFFARTWL